ncbi:MAG TPA: subclass B3 metallo-beta-lactamase [Rhizomicrobium sp.]|jgi:metallo-beta-lactamase class B
MRLLPSLLLAFTFVTTAHAATPVCNPELNTPQKPFRIYGNTYYVGTHGVSSVLVVSDKGLVLIDGDLARSVPQIAANIAALGFRVSDVKLILNSHVHCDHAGGIAALQTMSGAEVKASPWSAEVLRHGGVGRDDPQYGIEEPIAAVARVSTIGDRETIKLGSLALTAHFTPGHTPGGTSWTWVSCAGKRCLHMVYADSLSAISEPDFRFSAHPKTVADFRKSFAVMETLPCDVLVTVHPEVNDLWSRLDKRAHGAPDALIDPSACRNLAAAARANFDKRLAKEAK